MESNITTIPTDTPADRAIRIRAALIPHFGSEAAIDKFMGLMSKLFAGYAQAVIADEIAAGRLYRSQGNCPFISPSLRRRCGYPKGHHLGHGGGINPQTVSDWMLERRTPPRRTMFDRVRKAGV